MSNEGCREEDNITAIVRINIMIYSVKIKLTNIDKEFYWSVANKYLYTVDKHWQCELFI